MIQFTNIKGEPLPEDINKVANERYDREIPPDKNNELKISAAFWWVNTIESGLIWNHVNHGNYKPFREFHKTK